MADPKLQDQDKEVITPDKGQDIDSQDKEVEIDTSKIEEEIIESAKQKLSESLVGKKQEKWIPKDYEEIKEVSKKEALEEFERINREKEEASKKQVEEAKKQEVENYKKWQEIWNKQVESLTEAGHLPKVDEEIQKKLDKGEKLSKEEMEDPGIAARSELYQKAQELKESNLELVYYRDMQGKRETREAEEAPIFGLKKSVTQADDDEEFSYEDITVNPALGGRPSTSQFLKNLGK